MIVSTEGDLGDAVYMLGILSQLNDGPHELLLQGSGATKFKGEEGARRLYDLFHRLADIQPYIKLCRIADGGKDHVDWKSAEFRGMGYQRGQSLFDAHLAHLITTKNVGHGISGNHAWLFNIEPNTKFSGRVAINRTGRYRNSLFPWREVVQYYRNRIIFVGLHHEWREFCGHFGYVEYAPTPDLLGMAQIIAASDLFIGNQSCAYACAEGLKHHSIQETNLGYPDCIYARDNAQYCHDGAVTLPSLSGMSKPSLKLDKARADLSKYSTKVSPPGRWQFPGVNPQENFKLLVKVVSDLPQFRELPKEDVEREALMFNLDRCPGWQRPQMAATVMAALHQAGVQTGFPNS